MWKWGDQQILGSPSPSTRENFRLECVMSFNIENTFWTKKELLFFKKTIVTSINFLLNNIKGLRFVCDTGWFVCLLSLGRPHKTNCKLIIPNQRREVYWKVIKMTCFDN